MVPTWTLRLVFPRPLDRFYDAYQIVVRQELETPLYPATVRELKWYFEHRPTGTDQRPGTLTQGFLDKASQVFGGRGSRCCTAAG